MGTVTTNVVKPGLPSPSSTSETSDYQRSTPSPNAGSEDQLRSLGTTEIDWSQTNHPCNDRIDSSRDAKLQNIQRKEIISSNSNQNQEKIQNNNQRRKSTSSLIQNTNSTPMLNNTSGISVNVNSCNPPNKCASENNREQTISTSSNNSNLVLQQLRVALKKLPEAKLQNGQKVSLKPIEAVKRRHSDCGLISNLFNANGLPTEEVSGVKKAKLYQQQPHNRKPLSASIPHSKGQGKITAYLPEMK